MLGAAHQVGLLRGVWTGRRQPLLVRRGGHGGNVLARQPHLVRHLARHVHVARALKACAVAFHGQSIDDIMRINYYEQ